MAWTNEEIEFVKQNFINLSYLEIAKKLGKTYKAVDHKIARLGLSGQKQEYIKSHIQTYKTIGSRKRASNKYNAMLCRVRGYGNKRNISYKNIKVKVSREDFIMWYMPRDFEGASVDRIDSSKDYELSNMRVISLSENSRIARVKSHDGKCVCRTCGEEKPLELFVKTNRTALGYDTICRECEKERARDRYKRLYASSGR